MDRKEKYIYIETSNVTEARSQLESENSHYYLLSDKSVFEAKTLTIKSSGKDTQTAFQNAKGQIPDDAEILEEKVTVMPEVTAILVEATSEEEIQNKVYEKHDSSVVIQEIILKVKGKKGFLGIGAKPNQYEVNVFQPASTETAYKITPKIAFFVVEKEDKASLIEAAQLLDDKTVQLAAIELLGAIAEDAIGDLDIIKALADIINNNDFENKMHIAALQSLGKISNNGLKDQVMDMLSKNRYNLAVIKALEEFQANIQRNIAFYQQREKWGSYHSTTQPRSSSSGYFGLFSWPYLRNKDQLAREHFEKAKAGLQNLNMKDDLAFCVAANAPGQINTGMYVLYLAGEYHGNNDHYIHENLQQYFKECECPDYQEFESPFIGHRAVTVNNFAKALEKHGIKVLIGPVIVKNSKVVEFEGNSILETAINLASTQLLEKIIEIKITDVKEDTITMHDPSVDEAIALARRSLPKNIFNFEVIKTEEPENGCWDIYAETEQEARREWVHVKRNNKNVLGSAKYVEFDSESSGHWTASWSTGYRIHATFKRPAVIIVKVNEKEIETGGG